MFWADLVATTGYRPALKPGWDKAVAPLGRITRFNQVGIIEAGTASRQQSHVPVHRVLVEWNQQIKSGSSVVAILSGPVLTVRKGVTSANDGLIGVVGIEMQPATAKDLPENIARVATP